jgi:hypothetical protein
MTDDLSPRPVPTSGELRSLSPADVRLFMRETDNPDTLYLLSLVQIENNRLGIR